MCYIQFQRTSLLRNW